MAQNPLASIPIIGGLFDDSADKARAQLEQNKALYEGIALPDQVDFNPEMYKWLQDYDPEAAQYQTISEDPRLKTAQLSALSKMAGLADTGLSDVDELGYLKAANTGNQIARQGNSAALQNAQARGIGGSGLEFAMREMANQEGADRAQEAALAQAADADKMRAMYMTAYGDQLGNVRSQDLNASSKNADIINQFNMANTNTANQAQQFNVQGRQNLSNQNVDQRNNAVKYKNDQSQQQFNNQMAKAGGVSGQNTAIANSYNQEGAANTENRNALTKAGAGIWIGSMAKDDKKKDGVI